MQEVLIIGAGGHGRTLRCWLEAEGRYRPTGWLDSDPTKLNTWTDALQIKGLPFHLPDVPVVLGVGWNCGARHTYFLKRRQCLSVIHPLADIPSSVRRAKAIQVGPFVHVDRTARVGFNSILHVHSQVHHDADVGQAVFVGPSAVVCGFAKVGHKAKLGANCTILPGVKVGNCAVIGAGVTITKDVPDGVTMIQKPAITLLEHRDSQAVLASSHS